MRKLTKFLALAAVCAATPAVAQIDVGLGGQVGGNVGVGANPGGLVGGVTGTLQGTVDAVDRTANRTVNGAMTTGLSAATSADLTSGAVVRDRRGSRVGTVQSVHGDTAVVVKGDRTMHVPVSQLYRGTSGLVTSLTKSELNATAAAQASANAGANIRN